MEVLRRVLAQDIVPLCIGFLPRVNRLYLTRRWQNIADPQFEASRHSWIDLLQWAFEQPGFVWSTMSESWLSARANLRILEWARSHGCPLRTLAARLAAAERATFDLWRQTAQPAPENAAGVDPTAVLLARLRIPAQQNPDVAEAPIPDWSAAVWADEDAHIDNRVRHVLLPAAAVRRVVTP